MLNIYFENIKNYVLTEILCYIVYQYTTNTKINKECLILFLMYIFLKCIINLNGDISFIPFNYSFLYLESEHLFFLFMFVFSR